MYRFFVPTEVHFGVGCLKDSTFDLSQFGKRALLVTGRHSARSSGAFDDCVARFKACGVSCELFDSVGENPDIDTVLNGADAFRSAKADFVVGVGGGSPIDAAKAISVIAANKLSATDIYDTNKMLRAYPIVAVPLTSGTGSEVTPYSVITDVAKKKKAGFTSNLTFPKIAFVDPAYTVSTSEKVTRDTAIDALSHLLEGIYSKKRNRLLYPLIFSGAKLIIENLNRAIEAPNNLDAREALSKASLYGGMTIAQAGTTLQHSIGYPLTTDFGLSHGAAGGVVMQYVMELYGPHLKDDLEFFFHSIGMKKNDFFKWLEGLDFAFDLPIDDDFLARRVPEVMQSRNMPACPFDVTPEDVTSIYCKLAN